MQRHDDITRAEAMERLGLIGVIGMCCTLVLLLAMFLLGAKWQMAKVIALCDQGGKFYKLGEVDQPYRCTRVIDYPPSTTEGSTQ